LVAERGFPRFFRVFRVAFFRRSFLIIRVHFYAGQTKDGRTTIYPENPQGGSQIMAKVAAKKAPSKSEVLNNIAEATGLKRPQVSQVLDALANEIKKSLGGRGSGVFAIPGLVKIERKKVPARPARKGVPNPFKPGELMDVPAKPASTKIKVRALKALKAMA
jgi:nucleoid DNA-binding protein